MLRKITQKQRILLNEINDICEYIELDYQKIIEKRYTSRDRSIRLEMIKREIIVGHVISWYTLIDEFLGIMLAKYFIKEKKYANLIGSKIAKKFDTHILQEMYIMQKLEAVDSIRKLPTNLKKIITNTNSLRNGLAHTFVPETRIKNKPIYPTNNGLDIFTFEGIKQFRNDMEKIHEYFYKRTYGR